MKQNFFRSFLLLFCVHQCLNEKSTFQDATVGCLFYTGRWKGIYVESKVSTNSLKNSCADDSTREAYVTIKGFVNTIHKNSIADLPNLKRITISHVGLEKIEPGAFKNLSKLNEVSFYDNNLKEIESGTFYNLTITDLSLKNNKISVLGEKSFQNLPNLKALNLENNNLKKVQKGIFDNVGCWLVQLGYNRIFEVDAGAFEGVTKLNTLELVNNSFSALRLGDLANIHTLRFVSLSGNKLKDVPEGVFNGSKIVDLNLSGNEISTVASRAFDNMENLQSFRISNNKLRILDAAWFNNSWIQHTLPWFGKSIDISYNQIEEIPAEAFKNLPKSHMNIELQGNRIKKIADGAFNGLEQLDLLNVGDNEITEWNENWLKGVDVYKFVNVTKKKIV